MPMRCYFLTRQVAVKFWPVYKSKGLERSTYTPENTVVMRKYEGGQM